MPGQTRVPRQSIRYPVRMTARCRNSSGRVTDVVLSDISVDGCGVTVAQDFLKRGQTVTIRLQSLEGLTGQVCWVRDNRAGVKFDWPLYGPVLDHLVRVQLTVAPDPHQTHKPVRW